MPPKDILIEVEVRLYAVLRRHRPGIPPGEGERLMLPQGTTILDLIAGLGIPEEEVRTVFLNRRAMSPEAVLQSGDRVDLFPAIAGG